MIRKYIMDDIPFIVDLENKTLNTTLGSEMLINDLDNELSTSYVYLENDKVIGYISIVFDGEIVEILNYCVAPEMQNKGIGKELLNYVLDTYYAKNASSVILEVRESNNRAIHVYEKLGFKKISIRRNYYSNGENALVLQKLYTR